MADVSKLQIGSNGTVYTIRDDSAVHTVDSSLSSSSTNPVQNKVITTELGKKENVVNLGTLTLTLLGAGSYSVSGIASADVTAINAMSAPYDVAFSATVGTSNISFCGTYSGDETINGGTYHVYVGEIKDSYNDTKSFAFSILSTGTTGLLHLLEYAKLSELATVATTGDYDDLLNKPTDANGVVPLSNGGTGIADNSAGDWYTSMILHPHFEVHFNSSTYTFTAMYYGPLDGISDVASALASEAVQTALRSEVPVLLGSTLLMTGTIMTDALSGQPSLIYILFPDAVTFFFQIVNGIRGTLTYDANDGLYLSSVSANSPYWYTTWRPSLYFDGLNWQGALGASKTLSSLSQSNGIISATATDIAIASNQVSEYSIPITPTVGDRIAVFDSTDSNKLKGSLQFGFASDYFLAEDGTWGQAEVPTNKVTTIDNTNTDSEYPSAKAVYDAISGLPTPMQFKGTVGTSGTIEWANLPSASSSNEGFTYKVITDHSTAPICKVGDTIISNGSSWVVIPSGDEPSGTVTNVAIANGGGLTVSGSPITSSGTITISHDDTSSQASVSNSGRTYIQSVTLDTYGHVTGLTSATETVVDNNTTYTFTSGTNGFTVTPYENGTAQTAIPVTVTPSILNNVTGSGTATHLAKFSATNTIEDAEPTIDTNGLHTSKAIFLQNIDSSVTTTVSRLYFGSSPSSYYSYLSSNTSGAFTLASPNGNFTLYANTAGYNCLMNNCGADLGRNDGDGSKSWNNLYTKGGIKVKKSGTNGFWSLSYPQKDGTIATLADIPTVPTNTSDLTNDGSDGTSTYVETDEFTTVTASKATAGTAVSCYKSGGVVSQTSYTSGVGFTVAEGTVTATSVYTGGGTVSQTSYSSESITPYTFADVTALAWAT